MTSEDILVAKLKGYNVLVKFKDGEELLLSINELSLTEVWFTMTEHFINSTAGDDYDTPDFSAPNIAVSRDSIKYIIKL
jgi:hypothetical protein